MFGKIDKTLNVYDWKSGIIVPHKIKYETDICSKTVRIIKIKVQSALK